MHGIQEVKGSIPFRSTKFNYNEILAKTKFDKISFLYLWNQVIGRMKNYCNFLLLGLKRILHKLLLLF